MTIAGNQKMRALVCDNEKGSYTRIRRFLEDKGFVCHERVATVEEMIDAIARSHESREWFHVILIDVDMGGAGKQRIDGPDILFQLQARYPDEPYMLYSRRWEDHYRHFLNMVTLLDVKFVVLDELLANGAFETHLGPFLHMPDPSRVFLVQGKNSKRNRQFENLLGLYGLKVVGWEQAAQRARGNKFIYDIVVAGMQMSHTTVVLFTDDEEVVLRRLHRRGGDNKVDQFEDKSARRQSRANVFIEAGYALGVRPNRTVFAEWSTRGHEQSMPSDFAGMHTVRYRDTTSCRERLLARLESTRLVLNPTAGWRTKSLS